MEVWVAASGGVMMWIWREGRVERLNAFERGCARGHREQTNGPFPAIPHCP